MIARVFPRKTKLTPDDSDAYIGSPDLLTPHYDSVHISVLFKQDKKYAECLGDEWRLFADNIEIGGPAYDAKGGFFYPGQYVKFGAVITSRGCPNNCWFCDVPDREGDIRELPITEGWNLLDNNILACSDDHIKRVFAMLKASKVKYHKRIELTGGLEAKRLKGWHCELMQEIKPYQIFFAYDTPDDYEPLANASNMLDKFDISIFCRRCYVLIGYKGDTINQAEQRLEATYKLGFTPMAMLFENSDKEWRKFQRLWARPALIRRKR